MSNKASRLQRLGWFLEGLLWDALMGVFARLPIEKASALGGGLLSRLGPLLPAHKTALMNAKLVFPDLDEAGAKKLAMAAWDNLGRLGGEFVHLREMRPYAPDGRVVVEGLEHVQAIKQSGKPSVIITGHFANWEVMAVAICQSGLDARVSYRHANNPHIDKRITDIRRGYGAKHLSAKGEAGAREMLLALRRGQTVTFLNDQKFNRGIDAPFFGHLLKTAPGPSRLAMRFDVPLLPVSVKRLPGARFVVRFHAPITPDDSPDKTKAVAATVAKVNAFLEDRIRENPKDWFWVHRRWPKAVYRQGDTSSDKADAGLT
jgi:Kdo2-lipid IVA lauroyltransferase/acyltransferase